MNATDPSEPAKRYNDSLVDSLASVVVITIVVAAVVFWLSGQ